MPKGGIGRGQYPTPIVYHQGCRYLYDNAQWVNQCKTKLPRIGAIAIKGRVIGAATKDW
jgi:hypothetical protein